MTRADQLTIDDCGNLMTFRTKLLAKTLKHGPALFTQAYRNLVRPISVHPPTMNPL
jgi:hypothetical protein